MATYNKFDQFVLDLGKGVHELHAAGHTLKAFLTNQAPQASGEIKAHLPEISNENGYSAPVDIQQDYTESGGVGTLTGVDVVINATGSVGPFRYVALYNDDPAGPVDPLIAWWDYGSEVTLASGESFTLDFGAAVLTIE